MLGWWMVVLPGKMNRGVVDVQTKGTSFLLNLVTVMAAFFTCLLASSNYSASRCFLASSSSFRCFS